MKKILFLFLLILLVVSCSDKNSEVPLNPIENDPLYALAQKLPGVFSELPETRAGSKTVKEIVPITEFAGLGYNVYTATKNASQADLSSVYAINYDNDEGYAIVSTDPLLPEVFCYSDFGNITDDIDNPGFKMILEVLPGFVEYIYANDGIDRGETVQTKGTGRSPMLTTKWGQGTPFNDYAPICPSTQEKMPAGCAATAVAQIMAYHKFPASIRIYTTSSTPSPYITTPIDWDAVRSVTKYDGFIYGNQTYRQQVANLFGMVQHDVKMNFGCEGSGANIGSVMGAFREVGYWVENGGGYNWPWVEGNLDRGEPMYIQGFKATDGKGHAWVIDGYMKYSSTTVFLHCNWGWDGYSNGYYIEGFFGPGAPDYLGTVMLDPDTPSVSYRNYTESRWMLNKIHPL